MLRGLPACASAPLIAVLDDGAMLKPIVLPAGVADWLHASQIERELLARWQRLQQATTRSLMAAEAGDGDYRLAFD